jgi:hypothetical protein
MQFLKSIFNLQLVESADAEPMDSEVLLSVIPLFWATIVSDEKLTVNCTVVPYM